MSRLCSVTKLPCVFSLHYRTLRASSTAPAARRFLSSGDAASPLSRSVGPSHPPLLEQTIPAHFESIVNAHGSRTAVYARHQSKRLSYEDLDRQSNALAAALQKVGVGKGDRVAASLGNNSEFAILTYACFKLGAILVPLNPGFTEPQVASALNHLAASHLVIGLETRLSRRPPRPNVSLIASLLGSSEQAPLVPSLKRVVLVNNVQDSPDGQGAPSPATDHSNVVAFSELLASENGSRGPPDTDSPLSSSDVVNIQFTSGTTSMPKAAQLSHRNILNNGFFIGERMLLTSDDIVVCPPPLFHCFGCILGYMATATHGSSIVFPAEAFDPLSTLLAVQEEHATALYGVPTMFLAMLELIADGTVEHKRFDRLRTGIAAGSNIPIALMQKLHSVLNLTELTICYGMTETSPVSCMTTTLDPMQMRTDSVGQAMPHVELRVVDRDDRARVLPRGERGELVVSGYHVMRGYYADPEKTDEVLVEETDEHGRVGRWMHTGDEAEMTPEGYVKITGRMKDLIIRGGENIHPLEIENCLLRCDKVLDVSVVGVKDERYGEVVAAFVIRKPGSKSGEAGETATEADSETIKDFVRSRLSSHLVPKYVFFTESLPKTASGKIQKFVLRDDAAKLIASGSNVHS